MLWPTEKVFFNFNWPGRQGLTTLNEKTKKKNTLDVLVRNRGLNFSLHTNPHMELKASFPLTHTFFLCVPS